MALRMAMLKSTRANMWCRIGLRRWTHVVAQPATPDGIIGHTAVSPPLVLPEFDPNSKNNLELPRFSFGGSMELMAVPKKKVSPHKRGIRNGPKALKPVPVIIRCKSCGRVKLPHFYCCSGQRGNTGEQSGPAN
ncbi:uncharacterized protein LOC131143762 [Malania oleifera]|uniref:uncharacterized protein LOC131143762 n=1 Tax=Malania oleifera TaxID=397392 RepID=UPI0025AD9EB2|nr:uncharacterized protein LOC131143762 [Malania oleifera]